MASSASFTASLGTHKIMLEREVTPLGEPGSSDQTESLLGEGESSENTLSLPPNEPPPAPINISATLAIPRKRENVNPRVTNPKPSVSSKGPKGVDPTLSLILNIHGCQARSRSTFLNSLLGNKLKDFVLYTLFVMSQWLSILWLDHVKRVRECT